MTTKTLADESAGVASYEVDHLGVVDPDLNAEQPSTATSWAVPCRRWGCPKDKASRSFSYPSAICGSS
jgi:hypothetical protein